MSNGEEALAGSDPFDSADVPYIGGWGKDADCRHERIPGLWDQIHIAPFR